MRMYVCVCLCHVCVGICGQLTASASLCELFRIWVTITISLTCLLFVVVCCCCSRGIVFLFFPRKQHFILLFSMFLLLLCHCRLLLLLMLFLLLLLLCRCCVSYSDCELANSRLMILVNAGHLWAVHVVVVAWFLHAAAFDVLTVHTRLMKITVQSNKGTHAYNM